MIAAIYARKSTEQTGVADHEKSVTRQIDHATDYATSKGWTVAQEHIYSDDGISGAEFANRPGFLRLMNVLTPTPPFQVLIMSEESRLGREAIETAYTLKQLVTAGVRVFFYLEDRERTLDSPTDKIMLSLTAYADELEREKARQRTYDAMVRKAKAGHVTGGGCSGMTMSKSWAPPMTTGASAGLTSCAASILGRPRSSARSSPAVRTDGACAGSQSISTSNELPAHERSGVGHGRGHRRPSERCSTGTCIAERLCGIRAGSAIGGAGPDNKPGPRQSGSECQRPTSRS